MLPRSARRHQVVQRAVAAADVGRISHCPVNEVKSSDHGWLEILTQRQPSSDGSGQRAAGAVGGRCVYSLPGEGVCTPTYLQHIRHLFTCHVSSLYQGCLRPHLDQAMCRCNHVVY